MDRPTKLGVDWSSMDPISTSTESPELIVVDSSQLSKRAEFLSLNGNEKFHWRNFVLDYDSKTIHAPTIFHFDSPIPTRWWEDALQINLHDVLEIRQGLKTDKWINYRNIDNKGADSLKLDNYYHFSIVFKPSVEKESVDLMIHNDSKQYVNSWIKDLLDLLHKIRLWEKEINLRHEIMLKWNFSTYIDINRSPLERRIVQGNQTFSRFTNRRKLREFIKRLNIDIENQYLDEILRTHYKNRDYSIKDKKHRRKRPKFKRFETVVNEFDCKACFDFLFYKYSICKTEFMNANGLRKFFQHEQGIDKSPEECSKLIDEYEKINSKSSNVTNAQLDCSNGIPLYLTRKAFYRLLESDQFGLFEQTHLTVSQDMSQPMTHYFIATSHNTYLTGNQLTSASSYEMYRQILLSGCRCVEIDVWDGNDQPVVYHGYTMTSKIMLRNVLETINEVAFVTSQYPVILSIENRCQNLENHRKMAKMMREIFKDRLHTNYIGSDETRFPSPEQLKGKIFVKGSISEIELEMKPMEPSQTNGTFRSCIGCVDESSNQDLIDNGNFKISILTDRRFNEPLRFRRRTGSDTESDDDELFEEIGPLLSKKKSNVFQLSVSLETTNMEPSSDSEFNTDPDTDFEDNEEMPDSPFVMGVMGSRMSKIVKNPKVHPEFCALINYFKTRKFKKIEECLSNFKFYEMISRDENSSFKLISNKRAQYERFCLRNMVRIYPKGTRQNSSNYNPLGHWNVGAQLVALNYQTMSNAMSFNRALFALNGNCGYVLKPEFLRGHPQSRPQSQTVEVSGPKRQFSSTKIVAELKLQLLFGQFWNIFNFKEIGLCVKLSFYYPGEDFKFNRKRLATKIVTKNGFNPVWNETFFVDIEKPELSFVSFTLTNNGTFVGQYMISFVAMQKGLRHIPLYDAKQNLINMCRLFLYVDHKQVERQL